jgi:hypothetical protein
MFSISAGLLSLAVRAGGAALSDELLEAGEGVSARASYARQNKRTDQQMGREKRDFIRRYSARRENLLDTDEFPFSDL